MKFYTPELLIRFGSEDLKIAKAARQELEQKADEYVNHLDRIRPKLPPRFAELQEKFYLHDARVVAPVFPWPHPDFLIRYPFAPWNDPPWADSGLQTESGRVSSFVLLLQLDTPPQEFLVLHYRFVVFDEVNLHPGLGEERWTPLEWIHDEVALISSDDQVEFGHSILFTHGLELRLRFMDFDYATLRPMGERGKKGQK
jgi:hypothetical protein